MRDLGTVIGIAFVFSFSISIYLPLFTTISWETFFFLLFGFMATSIYGWVRKPKHTHYYVFGIIFSFIVHYRRIVPTQPDFTPTLATIFNFNPNFSYYRFEDQNHFLFLVLSIGLQGIVATILFNSIFIFSPIRKKWDPKK
jgi:hypothetical protein